MVRLSMLGRWSLLGEGRPMIKPLFATLFAALLSMPGCGREEPTRPPLKKTVLSEVRVGQPVPELAAPDLEGVAFKLSDYRGKVVALSFWADWCVWCRKLFPHEKRLVQQFHDQPFVLLGVNGDATPARGKKSQDANQLTWRSFWIGDPDGAIPTQWEVEGWPTTFVIDANGILRYRFDGAQPDAVERAVEKLLREMPRKE